MTMSGRPAEDILLQQESILQEAERIINGPRRQEYGSPLDSFDAVGRLWSVVLGVEVSAEQAALCMLLLKVQRATNGWHRDSVVDIAGYAGCLELIRRDRLTR